MQCLSNRVGVDWPKGHSPWKRIVHQFLDAWLATAVLSGENLSFPFWGGRNTHTTQIVEWVYMIVNLLLSDPHLFFSRCKEFAFSARQLWTRKSTDPCQLRHSRTFTPGWLRCRTRKCQRGRERSLLQWSYLGRALPQPPVQMFQSAQDEMRSRITSVHDSRLDFKTLDRVACGSAQDFRIPIQSHGACSQFKRPLGRRHLYARLLHDSFGDTDFDKDLGAYGLPYQMAVKSKPVRASLWNRDFLKGHEYSLASDPVPVPERGWKVRMVSRSCGIRVAYSHSYRKDLIRQLLRHRSFSIPQSGDYDFLPIGETNKGSKVFSADLSAATDNMSRSLLEQISAHLGIPSDLVCGGTVRFGTEVVEMTRGTLMGIPLSFPFLNLVHVYMCKKIGAPWWSYYIMGDDLIAVWPPSLIRRYSTLLTRLTGMVPNNKKSFCSDTRGIFCERAYHLAKDGLRINREYLSVRGLLPFGKPANRGQVDQPGLPWELSPLLYLQTALRRVGHSRAYFAQGVVGSRYLDKVRYLSRKHKISVHLPIHLGGAGVIPSKGNYAFSKLERTALDGFMSGDRVCQARMRAVRLGAAKLKATSSRSSARFSQASDLVVFRAGGEGLGEYEGRFNALREYCEDIASAEFTPEPEDVSTGLWFRTISSYPMPVEAQVPQKWTYNTIRAKLSTLEASVPPDAESAFTRCVNGLLPRGVVLPILAVRNT